MFGLTTNKSIYFIVALFYIILIPPTTPANLNLHQFEQEFFIEFNKLETNGIRSNELVQLTAIQNIFNLQCLTCRASVYTLLEYFKSNYTVTRIKDAAVTMCTLFSGGGSEYLCTGYVNNFAVSELELQLAARVRLCKSAAEVRMFSYES